ncbi:transporter substrate-binding domain-containing protein [Propionivibrio dicarboxylicus]|uniref:Amino acid ABC transporter substrate-binding protein, PAAT family (TC 3.A.1.3.-) n=1 Tax=Propionivibrio dicarboxylicus TaxID=83767 RepID=A0A1G8JJM2_9RHOO|nr:transporter substrate-binding domain-containing protein [Propionivibrio dicarboxylicus]SDI31342.1 amino acid ABC transporter substrate-binding protein, PAAT family (TC 3.A.1.3.-) [Propionivibrio dicarboxylicus]
MLNRFLRSLTLVSTVVLATLAPSAHADVLANVTKSGTIKIAVPQDFPPFGSVGADMKPSGYDIDFANLIGKELGAKVELVPVSSANRVPFLTTGKVDLVVSSMGKNAEREKVIDFSAAYAPFFNGIFGPDEIKASKADELAGRTISVTRGSVEDLELSKIAPPSAVIKRFEDNNATITAYLSGQTQLIATGNVVAAAVNERSKLRRLSTKFLIKDSPCFVGLAKGEAALQAKVNEIIAKAKKSGALNEISQRWLHATLPAGL